MQKFRFNNHELSVIHDALARYLEMDFVNRNRLIRAIERTGTFNVYGYGSLMGDPHARPDTQFPGTIFGYERGPNRRDRHYRGLPDKNGVTLGLKPSTPEAIVHGLVNAIRFASGDSSRRFALRIHESILGFAKRESSKNPIYTYQAVNVRTQFGVIVAVLCGTDKKRPHPSYIGATDDKEALLSIEEAAAIIASSHGVKGASPRSTDLGYWRFVLDCTYKAGLEPELALKQLVRLANAFRTYLPQGEREMLEGLENTKEREGFDKRVFEPANVPVNAALVAGYIASARKKLGSTDPLPPARLALVIKRMRELDEWQKHRKIAQGGRRSARPVIQMKKIKPRAAGFSV